MNQISCPPTDYQWTLMANNINQNFQSLEYQLHELRAKYTTIQERLSFLTKAISEEVEALSGVAPRTMAAVAALSIESIKED